MIPLFLVAAVAMRRAKTRAPVAPRTMAPRLVDAGGIALRGEVLPPPVRPPGVPRFAAPTSPARGAVSDAQSRYQAYVTRQLLDAAMRAQADASRPKPEAEPSEQADYLNRSHRAPQDAYPEFCWYAATEATHPETLWRTEYDRSPGDHVRWWVNRDNSWGYYHSWGGFDAFRALGDLVSAFKSITDVAFPILAAVPWGDVVHGIEAVASLVPILGTAAADVYATAEIALEALGPGSWLEKALRAAYDYALASAPGAAALHPFLDPVVDVLIRIVGGEKPTHAVINAAVEQAPPDPSIGDLSPRSIAAALAAFVVDHMGVA